MDKEHKPNTMCACFYFGKRTTLFLITTPISRNPLHQHSSILTGPHPPSLALPPSLTNWARSKELALNSYLNYNNTVVVQEHPLHGIWKPKVHHQLIFQVISMMKSLPLTIVQPKAKARGRCGRGIQNCMAISIL